MGWDRHCWLTEIFHEAYWIFHETVTMLQGENKGFLVCKKKMATCAENLTRYTPAAFRQFAEAVVNLKFDEEPKYDAYRALFAALCGPAPARPIVLEELPKPGQKRAREEVDEEAEVQIPSAFGLYFPFPAADAHCSGSIPSRLSSVMDTVIPH